MVSHFLRGSLHQTVSSTTARRVNVSLGWRYCFRFFSTLKVQPPSLVVSTREALVRTDFSPVTCNRQLGSKHVPLSLNDIYVIDEQLPYAYFFKEHLCDIKLERSLNQVLSFFPMVGGRLCLDSLSIILDQDDTVPYSVGTTDVTAEEFLRMRHKPEELLPIFDPLPSDPWNSRTPFARIRVTHTAEGGTIIGANISHAVADGASCIHFIYCWGRQHRKLSYPQPSYDRSLVTTNGMLTPIHQDLLNLGADKNQQPSALGAFSSQILGFSSAIIHGLQQPAVTKPEKEERPEHEFVLLRFPQSLLSAMKAYGKFTFENLAPAEEKDEEEDDDVRPKFVSTNDLVTAAGWRLMRKLSGRHGWNMNVVVNIRGKTVDAPNLGDCGVGGLFGNGITAATAYVPKTDEMCTLEYDMDDETARRNIFDSAYACRTALNRCYKRLPELVDASRRGKPVVRPKVEPAFCTTSWQFPLFQIDFEDHLVDGSQSNGNNAVDGQVAEDDEQHGRPFAFHGQPVHPLPPGETFAAVVVPTACQGVDYQIFLPSHHAEMAKRYVQRLESLFVAAEQEGS